MGGRLDNDMLTVSLNFSNIACSDGGSYKCTVKDSGIDTNATTTLAIRRRCSFLIVYERLLFLRFLKSDSLSHRYHYRHLQSVCLFCISSVECCPPLLIPLLVVLLLFLLVVAIIVVVVLLRRHLLRLLD